MSKKNIIIVITILICALITGGLYFWILPLRYEFECKNRIYPELKEPVENVKKSVVGIIPESQEKELVSHNGIGSGIIFERNDDTYYVVTAAHVVEDDNNLYKIFTINTKFSGEVVKTDDNISFEISDKNYYDSLLNAKIEYVSNIADLAILSFKSSDDLPVIEFETNKLKVGDKVVAIGHPEGNRYTVTYGIIKSDVKSVSMVTKGTNKKRTDKIIEHNAYLNFGSSGGVLISENMKIAGINNGGAFNILGYFDKGFMIPYDIVQEVIKDWHLINDNDNKIIQNVNSWSKNKVTIKVIEVLDNNSSAILEINDKNDAPISWGYEFAIQKMSEGDKNYYDLISKGKIEGLRNLVSPDENGVTTMIIDWSNMYSSLKKGTYRIVKYNDFITLYSEPFNIE